MIPTIMAWNSFLQSRKAHGPTPHMTDVPGQVLSVAHTIVTGSATTKFMTPIYEHKKDAASSQTGDQTRIDSATMNGIEKGPIKSVWGGSERPI